MDGYAGSSTHSLLGLLASAHTSRSPQPGRTDAASHHQRVRRWHGGLMAGLTSTTGATSSRRTPHRTWTRMRTRRASPARPSPGAWARTPVSTASLPRGLAERHSYVPHPQPHLLAGQSQQVRRRDRNLPGRPVRDRPAPDREANNGGGLSCDHHTGQAAPTRHKTRPSPLVPPAAGEQHGRVTGHSGPVPGCPKDAGQTWRTTW